MANSQNGWPVATSAQQDEAPLIRDVRVPNGVLKGDVAVVFRWLARQYDARVERLRSGACWGWFVKNIEGSGTISNHASGTAVDFNADEHNMGDPPRKSFSQAQIDACHAIERASGGVLAWGGDWSRPDGMHWEIKGSKAAVAAFAKKIRDQEEDDMTSPAEVWAQDIDSSAGSYSASGALWTVLNRTGALNTMPTSLAQLKDTLDDLVADQDTDIDALGATLAFISGQLGLLLAPPSEDHPVVKAVRFAMVNPGE